MEEFKEEAAVKKNHTVDDIAYYVSWVFLALTAVVGVSETSLGISMLAAGEGLTGDLILGVVSAAMAVFIYLYKDRLRVEYDYTFSRSSLEMSARAKASMDFAQVFNRAKRKSLGSLDLSKVEAFGKVNSDSFRRFLSTPNVKTRRWFVNRGAELYYFFYKKDDKASMIVFEPSEDMVESIRRSLPMGAYRE